MARREGSGDDISVIIGACGEVWLWFCGNIGSHFGVWSTDITRSRIDRREHWMGQTFRERTTESCSCCLEDTTRG